MSVAVCVPTRARTDDLARCLASLQPQIGPHDRLLVGVDHGDLATLGVVTRYESAEVVECLSVGMIRKLNTLAEAAHGVDILAFTDDDAVPSAHWLDEIRAAFLIHPRLGAFGGRDILPWGGDPTSLRVGQATKSGRFVGNHHDGTGDEREVDFLKGVNLALLPSLFPIDVRLADRGAEPHSEIDLCLRAKRQGLGVRFDPRHVVMHFPAARAELARDDLRRLARLHSRNEMLIWKTHFPRWRWSIAFLRGIVVGSEPALGLAKAVQLLGRRRSGVVSGLASSVRGRLEGLAR